MRPLGMSAGFVAAWILVAGIAGAQERAPLKTMKVTVSNPTPDDWDNAPVVISAKDGDKFASARAEGQPMTLIQADDLDGDGKTDELVFPVNLKAGESRTYELTQIAPRIFQLPRAHTGMYVKTADKRGFEGPGWESDLVAFRIYWDSRNATDVFAKTTPTLSLSNLARTDVDYHHLTPWGMDVLKVKTAVGIGGFGAWVDGKVEKLTTATRNFVVRANGPYRAVCDLIYTDWLVGDRKLELTARMKICSGQDWVDCDLMAKATDGKPLPELLCGFVKHTEETTLISDEKIPMVGRWGNQALGEGEKPKGGNLGLAVMSTPEDTVKLAEDDVNHLIILKAKDKVSYRYMVDWYKDVRPAANAEDFKKMMEATARKRPEVKIEE